MSEANENVLVLVDEEGTEHSFDLLDIFEIEDNKYAVLFPLNEDCAEDEVVVMKYSLDDNGEELFSDIEDDDEWERVTEAYDKLVEEYDDLDDEDEDD
ncbi:MAG: DUF1292 domain-containing protein [Peptococcaceae bacterium]|nr:DUF1292 domain-containing protein [Peptococcaceae bacterium]